MFLSIFFCGNLQKNNVKTEVRNRHHHSIFKQAYIDISYSHKHTQFNNVDAI